MTPRVKKRGTVNVMEPPFRKKKTMWIKKKASEHRRPGSNCHLISAPIILRTAVGWNPLFRL